MLFVSLTHTHLYTHAHTHTQSRYSAELAMHYILKDDYNRAKYYTDIGMQGFLQVRSLYSESTTYWKTFLSVTLCISLNARPVADLLFLIIVQCTSRKVKLPVFCSPVVPSSSLAPNPIQEWSTLSPLFEENRAACLRGLQKIVEVKEFLEFASKTGVCHSLYKCLC